MNWTSNGTSGYCDNWRKSKPSGVALVERAKNEMRRNGENTGKRLCTAGNKDGNLKEKKTRNWMAQQHSEPVEAE